MTCRCRAIAFAFFFVSCTGAFAQSPPESVTYNQVDFQAEAQREVQNDRMQATLFVEANDSDPARIPPVLNAALADALAAAKKFPGVMARSGGYQTQPVYDRAQKLTGWRGRAELRLESREFESVAALIGRLQPRLQVASIGFTVSPEARTAVVDALTAEAIGAFRARADIARKALGARSYKIRRISLHSQGFAPPPRPLEMARSVAAAELAGPPVEAGTSRISVNASGSIEVEF